MFRFIIKTAIILLFANAYAKAEQINEIADIELESAETVLKKAYEPPLANETQAIQTKAMDEVTDRDNLSVAEEIILPKDIILVLDNSGSMKKNDPSFLVNRVVRKFINQQDASTQIGIVIFDQKVRFSVPLTATASLEDRETILTSLENINYKGLLTDSPAGMERAIYELKNRGRDAARKFIVFMTDGIVDTGEAEKDIDKSRWLREDLAFDAADSGIKILGIAFTGEADFQLIQSIAQKTGGEYYRILQAADLQHIFEKINNFINKLPEPESVTESEPAPSEQIIPQAKVEPVPPPPPVIIEIPAKTIGNEEHVRSVIVIVAVIILTITLLGILFLLLRRNSELKKSQGQFAQEAHINDLHGKTDKPIHKLGNKPVMFGRVAGKDIRHLDYIVVNEATIGRRHALIEFKDYSYWIIDQGSINGTFINGKPVVSEIQLKHGDRIRLHKYEFEFFIPEMQDISMTVVSNTSESTPDSSAEAATLISTHDEDPDQSNAEKISAIAGKPLDMNFDITSSSPIDNFSISEQDEDDTTTRDNPKSDASGK